MKTLSDEKFKPEIPTRVPSGLTPINHEPIDKFSYDLKLDKNRRNQ